ncbi:MAG TPA: ribulose-phosphate 3-epimerase [Deferrisomatales bacterium]|nr:ribulose-phosphate 3-epimerase [Deferrisomatales bacterium]
MTPNPSPHSRRPQVVDAALPAIAPSILSADFCRLGAEVTAIDRAGADWIHVDVMDGRFVPNLTIGPPVVRCVRGVTERPLDVHLMIVEPERYVEAFAAAGADVLTVHAETCPHLHRNLQQIRDLGVCPGVSLNPATPVTAVEHVLEELDLVLVMSVNPGFGGQAFLPAVLPKIEHLRRLREQRGLGFRIQVDGGITAATVGGCFAAGADAFVAGSFVFGSADYATPIAALRSACKQRNGI